MTIALAVWGWLCFLGVGLVAWRYFNAPEPFIVWVIATVVAVGAVVIALVFDA